jgi:hypothetical protein
VVGGPLGGTRTKAARDMRSQTHATTAAGCCPESLGSGLTSLGRPALVSQVARVPRPGVSGPELSPAASRPEDPLHAASCWMP